MKLDRDKVLHDIICTVVQIIFDIILRNVNNVKVVK